MSAGVFLRPAAAIGEAQRGGGATVWANCPDGSRRGGGSVGLLLPSKQVIDPCLFAQMEAWPVAPKGYRVSMNPPRGKRRHGPSIRSAERWRRTLWWVRCLAQRHLGRPTFCWRSRVTSRSADADLRPPHPSCAGGGDASPVLNR